MNDRSLRLRQMTVKHCGSMQACVIMAMRIKPGPIFFGALVKCVITYFAEGHNNGRDGMVGSGGNYGNDGGYPNSTYYDTDGNYTNGRNGNFTNDRDGHVENGYEDTSRGNRNDTYWNGCSIIVNEVEAYCSNYRGFCEFKTENDEHILSIKLITSNLTETCYKFDVKDTGIRGSSVCNGTYRVTTCQGCSIHRVVWKTVSSLLPYHNYRQYYSRRKNVVYRLTSSCEANVNYGQDQVGFWVTEECKDAIPFYCDDTDILTDENLPVVYKSGSTSQACPVYETTVKCKDGQCPIRDVQNIKSTLAYISRISDNNLDDQCATNLSSPLENLITCSQLSEPLRILTCDACEWSVIKCEKNVQGKTYCLNTTDDLIHYDYQETSGCRKMDTINRDGNGVYIQASCMSVEVKLLKCNGNAQVTNIYSTLRTVSNPTITSVDPSSSTSNIDHGFSKTTFSSSPISSTVSPGTEYKLNNSNYRWCQCSLCRLECLLPISANYSVENITAELLIDLSTTAKSKRKKISVPDYRPSAVTIGTSGILCVVSVVVIILSTDCISVIVKVTKMLKRKQRFRTMKLKRKF